MTDTLAMGTHLRVLSESSLMNTNVTKLKWFSKIFGSLYESSLSIGRVNPFMLGNVLP